MTSPDVVQLDVLAAAATPPAGEVMTTSAATGASAPARAIRVALNRRLEKTMDRCMAFPWSAATRMVRIEYGA
jgi:hypothetical protein